MPAKRNILLIAVLLTGFVMYFVASAFGRVWEIFDSLRVPGRIERLFFEVFQIGLGTGFLICLYLILIVAIYLYLQGHLDRLFENRFSSPVQ
jgi:hypothetical protein